MFGAIGTIAAIVYVVWFALNPESVAKVFLEKDGKAVGSYDKDKVFEPQSEPGKGKI